ncbi:MAG: OmpA family protein [Candidatus Omnitrophica bacterium]|nr:OmpA family protein [Candidatus Omnitrophota bacterium]
MRMKRIVGFGVIMFLVLAFTSSGCMVNFYKRNPRTKLKIQNLEKQIDDLEYERQKERESFEEVESLLESRLRNQISTDDVSMQIKDSGLVIVLSDKILFDSGQAKIKKEAYPVLNEVANAIKKKVPGKNIGVSGHTDNVPVTKSKWGTNWELSTARATNVLRYLEKKGLSSRKLSATGYGKHRPIASNRTEAGKAKNRRVEIVVLPEFVEKGRKKVKKGMPDNLVK